MSVLSVEPLVCGVRGDLIQWARLQQGRTMRWVREMGGPSPGYQSEVENGTKTEVRSELLARWVRILRISDAFVRGQVAQIHEQPAACLGLAGHVRDVVAAQYGGGQWATIDPLERTRQVLRLITQEPTPLPRVVLAHTLGVGLDALDGLLLGSHPVMASHMQAASILTTLPEHFFKFGELELPQESDLVGRFLPALRWAQRAGITPEELQALAIRRLGRS